jgi:hypothetical protein
VAFVLDETRSARATPLARPFLYGRRTATAVSAY